MKELTGRFNSTISIGDATVGPGAPTYIVAEIGSNHDQNLDQAKTLIREAAAAGADAVKFQTLDYGKLFHDETTDDEVAELYDKIELPEEWYPTLQSTAAAEGVAFFSSVTYPESIPMLCDLGVPAFKFGSGQVVSDTPLIRKAASKGLPLIISTGLGGYGPIERALQACLEEGNENIAVLHCISEYPTASKDTELRRIQRLRAAFGAVTGYSDHTESTTVPAAAVALGAHLIEKHITLDRTLDGPDHEFAVEPDTFSRMVSSIREVESALGDGVKLATAEGEESFREHIRMKLVAAEDIAAGSTLTEEVITARRSPEGVPRDLIGELERAGVSVNRELKEGSLITWEAITGQDDR